MTTAMDYLLFLEIPQERKLFPGSTIVDGA
jgi:hypothetical protein